jgi:hypothetical protein
LHWGVKNQNLLLLIIKIQNQDMTEIPIIPITYNYIHETQFYCLKGHTSHKKISTSVEIQYVNLITRNQLIFEDLTRSWYYI